MGRVAQLRKREGRVVGEINEGKGVWDWLENKEKKLERRYE